MKHKLLITSLACTLFLTGCVETLDKNGNVIKPTPIPSIAPTNIPVSPDLKIEDKKVGTGKVAKNGDTVSVHYVGTLTNETKFDSSRDRGQPYAFTLGQGVVIEGWDQGVQGMKVGGIRKLTIPPKLGYGDQAQGTIPANSTLIFEIELLEVK